MTAATRKFLDHTFWTPATTTWNDLKNGTQNSFTRADIKNFLWNSLICCTPVIAGGATAHVVNTYAHKRLPKESAVRPLLSFLYTIGSTVAGAAVSFFVIRLLAVNHGTLVPFSADKALKLETLHVVAMAALTILVNYFELDLGRVRYLSLFVGGAAVSGYFGECSLYVIGALSSFQFAVNASFAKPPRGPRSALEEEVLEQLGQGS